ncbi:TonB-dependent receptor domain-containing protein [Persicobacter psychrovividus]|uniref:TonB-dependent transporter Oar-like beta-barrel domain-containing protein n=1 Tax=Persicobacter psychrovividus TaxID=387638 RepID=A0ABN6LCP1_9BACT|nr:hypothetical protein PEPS_32250 [Persicobacter psychrovividus]
MNVIKSTLGTLAATIMVAGMGFAQAPVKKKTSSSADGLTKQINVFSSENATNDVPRELNTGIPGLSTKQTYSGTFFEMGYGTTLGYRNYLLSGQREQPDRLSTIIQYGYPGFVINYKPKKVANSITGMIGATDRGTRFMDAQVMQSLAQGWYVGVGLSAKDAKGPFHYQDGWTGTSGYNFVGRVGKTLKKGNINIDFYYSNIHETDKPNVIFNLEENGDISNTGFSDYNNYLLPSIGNFDLYNPVTGQTSVVHPAGAITYETKGLDLKYDHFFDNGWALNSILRFSVTDRNRTIWKPVAKPFLASTYNAGAGVEMTNSQTGAVISPNTYMVKSKYETSEGTKPFSQLYSASVLSKTFNKHKVAFGYNLQWIKMDRIVTQQRVDLDVTTPDGLALPITLTDAAGNTTTGAIAYNNQYGEGRDINSVTTSLFAKDDWKINAKFTLSYGYRLDIFSNKYSKILKTGLGVDQNAFGGNPLIAAKDFRNGTDPVWYNYNQTNLGHSGFLGFVYKTGPFRIDASVAKSLLNLGITKTTTTPDPNYNMDAINDIYMAQANFGYIKAKYGVRTGISYITKTNDYEAIALTDGTTIGILHNVKTTGFNVNAYAKPIKGLSMVLQYTYQEPKYDQYQIPNKDGNGIAYDYTGNTPTGIAKHIIEFNTSYKVSSRLSANALFRYQSKKALDKMNIFYNAPYVFTTAGLSYKLTPAITIGYRCTNLTNRQSPSGLTGLPKADPSKKGEVYGQPIVGRISSPREHVVTVKFKF